LSTIADVEFVRDELQRLRSKPLIDKTKLVWDNTVTTYIEGITWRTVINTKTSMRWIITIFRFSTVIANLSIDALHKCINRYIPIGYNLQIFKWVIQFKI
jgi:hypothetical protein